MYPSHNLAAGATVGLETGRSTASALDPAAVLATHPEARAVIGCSAKALMERRNGLDGLLAADTKTRTTEGPHAGEGTGNVQHDA